MFVAMPLLFLLVLELYGLIVTPGEAAVYYVTPTEPSNPVACPRGQPCHSLDYYFSHKEEYFDSSEVNVTMLLYGGEHVLSPNHTECDHNDCTTLIPVRCAHIITDLEVFEMIGIKPAQDVILQLFTNIKLMNVGKSLFVNLTIAAYQENSTVYVFGCAERENESKNSRSVLDVRVIFNTQMDGVIFNRVTLNLISAWSTNFITNVTSSLFDNQSLIISRAIMVPVDYFQDLTVTNCMFNNSGLSLSFSFLKIFGNVRFIKYYGYSWNSCTSSLFSWSSTILIAGDVIFADNIGSSISAYSSHIILSGNISFLNNTGVNGGAMALYSSVVYFAVNAIVYFYNNTAIKVGGAIYVNNKNFPPVQEMYLRPCFYRLMNADLLTITFYNNSAAKGGNDIYGEFMHSGSCDAGDGTNGYTVTVPSCAVQSYFHYHSNTASSVSSEPVRVCRCKSGRHLCNESYADIKVYPGEMFTLSLVIVGADFGATVGSVHAVFENTITTVQLKPSSQYVQGIRIIDDGVCSKLNYTVFSENAYEMLLLTTEQESWNAIVHQQTHSYSYFDKVCSSNDAKDYVNLELLYSQQLLSINLLPCPLGFQLRGDPPGCECHPVLSENNVKCRFINHTGYHIWSGSMWLDLVNDSKVYLAQYCPFDYCISGEKIITFQSDPSAQCAFNRAGRLCGGCKANYSLAIGSSQCIHCHNNNNLALLIFFAAAGFLLVVVVGIFNLTVTQGIINGPIFYANIVWTYQRILFSHQFESSFTFVVLRTLLAWINLDFGIHTCFVNGLTALHKTWPQYFFILYVWSIAIAIVYATNHSIKLTNILGDRSVPILVTLFLLSYTKLLQIIIASLGYTQINEFGANNSRNHTLTVWSVDGNYAYCHYPHVLLFAAAVLVFFAVWLPYTLVLFSIQWLRKISHLRLLKWIPKFNPVFDAHLAPLKDKHHYWFGVLLVVRGILLIILTLTYTVYPNVNYIVLLITVSLLLFYSNYYQVYKNRLVQFNESFFLLLLVFIGVTGILQDRARRIVVYVSIGVGLFTFYGMIFLQACCNNQWIKHFFVPKQPRRMFQQENPENAQFRDSILDEIEPLLDDEIIQDVATY